MSSRHRRSALVAAVFPGWTSTPESIRIPPVVNTVDDECAVPMGFARVLRTPAAGRQTYDVAGPVPVTFVDLLDEIGHALGRTRVRKVHVPLGPVKIMTSALHWLPFYPVSPDQLAMLEEESVGDPSQFFADLGVKPQPLAVGLHRMLGRS